MESENNQLKKENVQIMAEKSQVIREKDMKYAELMKSFYDLEARIDLFKEQYEKEKENGNKLHNLLDEKEQELARPTELLSTDKKILEEQLKKKELELLRADKKVEEFINTINYKNQKEDELKRHLSQVEKTALDYKDQIRKTIKDKEIYEMLADQRKKEADINKKLRDSQAYQSMEMLKEKKSLEGKLLEKEIEASRAKRDLNLIKDTREILLEDKLSKEKEIDALREHTEVLHSVNATV